MVRAAQKFEPRSLLHFRKQLIMSSTDASANFERRLVPLIRWGCLGLLSLVGGVLATFVTARMEAVPKGANNFEFARSRENAERELSGWRYSPSTPDFDMFVQNGWTIVAYLQSDGESIFMVHSWGIPEAPPKDVHVPSWSRASKPRSGDSRCLEQLAEIAYGWPMRSMVVEVAYPRAKRTSTQFGRYTVVGAAVPPKRRSDMSVLDWVAPPWFTGGFMADSRPVEEILASSPSFATAPEPLFPTRIIPIGFGVNTGFFSMVIGLVLLALRLAVLRVRVAARVRQGACRECGHALVRLTRCPECGAVVK